MTAETPADINKDVTRLSHTEEVSDVSNVQSGCPLGPDVKEDTVNESLDGTATADDTTAEAEEPPDAPNRNVVEALNRRRRRACLDGVDARPYNEGDKNNSKDEFETRPKKEKPTKPEDLTEQSPNSKDTNLNMNGKNSNFTNIRKERDFTVASSDEEGAEKNTRRKEAKFSNGKKPTTASSSKAKSVELVSNDESKDNLIGKEAAEPFCIDDSDELTICDGAAASRSRNNRPKRRDSAEAMSVYPRRIVPPRSAGGMSVYPRRIVPPRSGGQYTGRRPRKPLFETHRNKKTLMKVEDLTEEPRNSKNRNLDMNSENSKRRKLPVSDEKSYWHNILMTSSDEERAEKTTRRKETKVSNGKKPATASSSKAKRVELASIDESEDNSTEAILAFEQTWREKMRANEQTRQTEIIESNSEGPGQGSDVSGVEAMPKSLSGMKKRNLSQREEFPCPICSKNFPAEEIEVHAAGCEQYDEASSASGSGSNSLVVPMSLERPKQRDMSSNMPGTAGLQDREIVKPTSRKKLKIANEKKAPTASSSRTKSIELVSTDESKDNLAEAESIYQAELRIRDEAATRRKVERVKQRLQGEAKKAKLEERNEKLRLAFEQSLTEKLRAKRKVPSVELVRQNHSEMKESDVEVLSDDSCDNRCQPDRVLCPICSKSFSIEDIEAHAAHCEQYDAGSSANVSRSNSPVVAVSLETPEQRNILSNMPAQAGLQDNSGAGEFENGLREIMQSSLVDSSRIKSSRSSSRLCTQRERLQPQQQKEDGAKLVDPEEQRIRDEETTRREAVEQRVQEAAKKAKSKERKEQRRLILEQMEIDSETDSGSEGPVSDIPSTEVVPENHSGMGQRDVEERGDVSRRNVSQTEQVPCPVCDRSFPVGEIETHAAHCVEFILSGAASCSTSNSPVVPTSSRLRKSSTAGCGKPKPPVVSKWSRPPKQRGTFSTLLECYICLKFTARNGWEFEDHVTSCLARQREST